MNTNSGPESGSLGPPPGPPPVPPPGPPPGPPSGAGGRNRNQTAIVVGLVLLVVALVVALVVVVGGDNNDDQAVDVTAVPTTVEEGTTTTSELETTTSTDPGFTQAEGEIFLEAAASEGPDSFAGEVFLDQVATSIVPTSTEATVTPPTTQASTDPAPQTVNAVVGDTPALYGGTRDRAVCDKEGQLQFLQQNADKAAAFVAALNSDPNLLWSGGTSLTVAQLADYFAELTPVVLTSDTRMTNHGYRDGQFTSARWCSRLGAQCWSISMGCREPGVCVGIR